MTATAHILVAGALATKINDPVLLSALSFGSHFLLDLIPHWDFGTNWRNRPKYVTGFISISETLAGIFLGYILFSSRTDFVNLSLAIFFSILPDWLETPWYIFFARQDKIAPAVEANWFEKMTFNIYKLENRFHSKSTYPLGLFTQIATVGTALYLLR